MHNRHKRFTLPQKLLAGAIATGLLAAGIGTAWAGMGSGGTGASGSSGIGPNGDLLYVVDNSTQATNGNPIQGWGDDSIAYTINHLRQSGYPIPEAGYQLYDNIYSTCRDAIQNAINDKSDGPADKARVVGLAATIGQTNTLVSWGTNPTDFRNRFNNNWNYLASDGMQNDLTDWGDDWVNKLNQKFQDQITATGQLYPTGVSMVCVAVNNNQPVPQSYDLSVTTTQQAPKTLTIGDTTPVRDVIHASAGSSTIREKLNAKVILHADLPQGSYVPSVNPVSKTVTISNQGDTASPDFTPSDFGWDFWPEGTYWFDVQVAKQGKMRNAVDTADREPAETFKLTSTPPPAPTKQIDKGVSADGMTNTTRIVSGTGVGGFEMHFKDTISPNGVNYSVTNMKVTDTTANQDVTDQFTVTWDKAANTVSADRSADHGLMPANHDLEFSFDVTVDKPTDFKRVSDVASVAWNHEPAVSTESREFPTWQPKPDKAWVRFDKTTNKWQTVIDPDHTNTVGADGFTFMDGDKVGSVVNGTIAANLAQAPESLTLTDDYTNADYVWDTVKNVKDMRVFEVDATTDRHSSVADILNTGKDVTDQWTVTQGKAHVTASASKAYLKTLKGLPEPKQVTLLAPGVINLANGKGAQQLRKDYGKAEGEEVTTCVNPDNGGRFTNAGAERVNNHEVATNEPHICVYVPQVKKQILAESSQGGDQSDIELKTVYPGQKVEYRLTTQPTLPTNLGYTVEQVGVIDTFDPYLVPDKQTVEVTDLNSGMVIAKSRYTTTWDDKNHRFELTFDKQFANEQWANGATPRLLVRFEGTVKKDAPTTKTVDNKWELQLNNSLTPSNVVKVTPPTPTPHKADKSVKDKTVSIDGKTLLVGEKGLYQLTLDATDKNTAYKVWRLGMTDDFDERYVQVNPQDITIMSDEGQDVTDQFNIQVKDGFAYMYAKTVDTLIPATGETAQGDPQPADLAEYSKLDFTYDPLADPSINQELLGHHYTIDMPYTVIAGGDGVVVENTALQITNHIKKQTETVKNPIKELNPAKDVTVKVGGESKDTKAIYLNSDFLYQLDSSVMPADRAYPEIARWGIDDTLDPTVDKLSGQWAVYANADLYKDGVLVAAKGDKLAGSKFDSTKFGGDLFTAELDPATGKVNIQATDLYLQLVSADSAHEQAWRAYIQVKRIAVVEHHENQFTEHVGDQELKSNIVWTYTPDLTPSLHVEKYDVATGEVLGDRDDVKDALQIRGGSVEIGFKITNTSRTDPKTGKGATFTGKNLKLVDKTIAGVGTVEDFKYPENWDSLVLKPGESTVVTGTLKGVNAGDKHTDRVQVTGKPDIECPVSDPDPFGNKTGEMNATCDAPEVSSNTDDWSGYKLSLAQTGAQTASLALVAAVSLLAGVAGLTTLRRRNRARHIA